MPPAAGPGQGSSCWTSGAGLIPLQPGRSLRPSSARTGATQTRLEFFRGKVDCRGKTKALSKSSRRTTGLDQSVSAPRLHPGEATGAHWWGVTFLVPLLKQYPDFPAHSVVLEGLWQQPRWLRRLKFLADIFSKLNKISPLLQGK